MPGTIVVSSVQGAWVQARMDDLGVCTAVRTLPEPLCGLLPQSLHDWDIIFSFGKWQRYLRRGHQSSLAPSGAVVAAGLLCPDLNCTV